jgi:small GTP-binding protein
MDAGFQYDVFLSHSAKDKRVVRPLAERLRKDGLKVWFDEWEIKPGDSIPAKIEEGLEHSRVLVLCMSANAFGSDWAQLESHTFRFRDPLNRDRRFIPLRFDDSPIKGSLAQFLYINWQAADREQEYAKLLEACRPQATPQATAALVSREQIAEKVIQLDNKEGIWAYAFRPDGGWVLTGGDETNVKIWNVETGRCLRVMGGHAKRVDCVALSVDQHRVLSGGHENTLRLWDVATGVCLRELKGHASSVMSVEWSIDNHHALSGSFDQTIRLWDVETGRCLRELNGHTSRVRCATWSVDQRFALSAADDNTVRLWNVETGSCLRVLEGHTNWVLRVAWSPDQRHVLSGSVDRTMRLWDVETGRCLRVFKGHESNVESIAWSADQRRIVSASADNTVRLWDVERGHCILVMKGHTTMVAAVVWSADGRRAVSGDTRGGIRVWNLSEFVTEAREPKAPAWKLQTSSTRKSAEVGPEEVQYTDAKVLKSVTEARASEAPAPGMPSAFRALPPTRDQVQYTNAKVLIVGESGAGKTGLSKVLAGEKWQPSDSTVGAWATQWKLPVSSDDTVEREIWLWDFGGQADQRLIHQLYMDETALAVLVFDGQKEDVFETLGQWDRDLTRTSQKEFAKLLVAGRVDAGGLRVSRTQIETFKKERGYIDFLETSAKAGLRCEELKQAILKGIRWENIPWRSSPLLFKRLKEEIIRLKDEGRVLMRFNELRETLHLRLLGEQTRFTDEELKAVVSLLAGPGVVWELKFGSWVLLQPERINAYAQAVIQTIRADEDERGCIEEERVLDGDLTYHRRKDRLPVDEERFVLLAMHKILVERGLCLREHTDDGTMLIFPSYYRRERPEMVGHPAALVSYRFSGFLDDIYATLVVRMHHTKSFTQDKLWRYAADFKTLTGKQLGVKLERRAEGAGELVVYADPAITDAEKIIFSRYVHEHILQKGRDMVRLRHYVCPHCGTPVGNREVAMERLNAWLANQPAEEGLPGKIKSLVSKPDEPTIICSKCEKRVPLWDEMEQHFASDEAKERVRQLQAESDLKLDSESKDRALVGEVISTVALAGQIIEEYSAKRYGLDMEIEFKDDDSKPTAKKLYLQLKSGDSHLRKRQTDGAEVFQIHHDDHATYWMNQAYPVFLVIADSKGEVRWMEIRDYLRRASDNGKKPVKQIVFEGERFDVMTVRRWREKVLGLPRP